MAGIVAVPALCRAGHRLRWPRYTFGMGKPTLAGKLVVAISSRALFDLSESHRIYTVEGVDAYHRYQVLHEDEILEPGPAFVLARKLLQLNRPDKQYVEVILLSRNSADTGLRVFNSIRPLRPRHHTRCVHRGRADIALRAGVRRPSLSFGRSGRRAPRARRWPRRSDDLPQRGRLQRNRRAAHRLRRRCRAVLRRGRAGVSDERARGVLGQRTQSALEPLLGGPFKEFLAGLHRIQADFPEDKSPIRTALVTARSAPAHERVIRTLRAWNIRIDEALFLGGLDKGEFLRAFGADIFFDDQRHARRFCAEARRGGPCAARRHQRIEAA